MKTLLVSAATLLLLPIGVAQAEQPPLIPRTVLFGGEAFAGSLPQLSPDGSQIAMLADSGGVLNVFARPIEGGEQKLITHETHRPIFWYAWAEDGKHILYLQDNDGDENDHLYSVDLHTGDVRDLTPWRGIRAQNILTSARRPNEVLAGLNLRDRKVFDMYRINLTSGAITLEVENPGDVLTWSTDNDFVIRGATVFNPATAETIIRVRDAAGKPWRNLVVMPFEHALFDGQVYSGSLITGFSPDGKSIFIHSALHSDKGRLERIDTASGRLLRVVAEDPHSDVANDLGSDTPTVLTNPRTGAIQAVKFEYLFPKWTFLDPAVAADFQTMSKSLPGFLRIISRDSADRKWIVSSSGPAAAASYYIYDRGSRKLTSLVSDNPELAKYTLADKKPVIIKARDGLELVCFLATPPGIDPHNLPLIADIHGGPQWLDTIDYDPEIQFLTNRGYAVLQVNYRGSTGLGLRYLNLGNKEFGLGQEEDVFDAVKWAIDQGIADPKRIASYGWSGGGFATLRGLEMRPDLFACGVDGIGPADVGLLLRSAPPFWSLAMTRWRRRVGDADHDDAWNRKISPLYHVDEIRSPLLLLAGANDPRVTLPNVTAMVKALRDAKREVEFVVYTDEGHGFARDENNLDCYGRIEEFLAAHLGGRAEPWKKVEGSTADVR